MPGSRARWLNTAAAAVGGLAFGIGLAQLVFGISIAATAWTVIGLIILWWALADRRKWRRGTPESETDGSHTIE